MERLERRTKEGPVWVACYASLDYSERWLRHWRKRKKKKKRRGSSCQCFFQTRLTGDCWAVQSSLLDGLLTGSLCWSPCSGWLPGGVDVETLQIRLNSLDRQDRLKIEEEEEEEKKKKKKKKQNKYEGRERRNENVIA